MVVEYSIGAMAIGGFLLYKGFFWLKQKQMIENIPTSKIRSIAMGLVEIAGEVIPAYKVMLKSPLSQKDCVYYTYSVQEYRSSGKHSYWATLRHGSESQVFFLKDDTGKVLVDAEGSNLKIARQTMINSSMGKDPPEKIRRFLEAENIRFGGFLGINKRMRFIEKYIAAGDRLYIMGTADDNPHVEDGTGKDNVDDIMIQAGENKKLYYISDKEEHEVLKALKWQTIGGLAGGALLVLGGLTVTLIYLGLF